MKVAVIDYGSGNLASAARALTVAAEQERIRADVQITGEPAEVWEADRIVLPGQGAFADCAWGLAGITGLREAVLGVAASGRPFLGICVGMQLMAQRGLEHAVTEGFGWISGDIARMEPPASLRLPQMGWNELHFRPGAHPLLDGLEPGAHAYFVHSYALTGGHPEQIVATTDYGGAIPAIVAVRNVVGTQFHVEKSQEVGLRMLGNFLRWSP